jgi:hypothetical protein
MTRAVSRVLAIPASSRVSTTGPGAETVGVEVERQTRKRPRLANAGLLGELTHRASRRRGPQHTNAPSRIRLSDQAGGERRAHPASASPVSTP